MMHINVSYSSLQNYTPVLMMTRSLRLINCNDYGHTANNNGVCIHWSLHSEDSSNLQIISGMLQQLIDLRGEYFESYRCVDRSTNVECIN